MEKHVNSFHKANRGKRSTMTIQDALRIIIMTLEHAILVVEQMNKGLLKTSKGRSLRVEADKRR
jgi:hypothetical protein